MVSVIMMRFPIHCDPIVTLTEEDVLERARLPVTQVISGTWWTGDG